MYFLVTNALELRAVFRTFDDGSWIHLENLNHLECQNTVITISLKVYAMESVNCHRICFMRFCAPILRMMTLSKLISIKFWNSPVQNLISIQRISFQRTTQFWKEWKITVGWGSGWGFKVLKLSIFLCSYVNLCWRQDDPWREFKSKKIGYFLDINFQKRIKWCKTIWSFFRWIISASSAKRSSQENWFVRHVTEQFTVPKYVKDATGMFTRLSVKESIVKGRVQVKNSSLKVF